MSIKAAHAQPLGSWIPPRCAGCDADPIEPLVMTAVQVRYVFLTAQLCGDCRARVDQGERRFLTRRLAEVAS